MPKLPKLYLIGSGLSEDEVARVRAALEIAPHLGVFVFTPDDAQLALKLSDVPVLNIDAPLAVVGKFDQPLAVLNDDGSVETLIEGQPCPQP